jgi:hypothetical protein
MVVVEAVPTATVKIVTRMARAASSERPTAIRDLVLNLLTQIDAPMMTSALVSIEATQIVQTARAHAQATDLMAMSNSLNLEIAIKIGATNGTTLTAIADHIVALTAIVDQTVALTAIIVLHDVSIVTNLDVIPRMPGGRVAPGPVLRMISEKCVLHRVTSVLKVTTNISTITMRLQTLHALRDAQPVIFMVPQRLSRRRKSAMSHGFLTDVFLRGPALCNVKMHSSGMAFLRTGKNSLVRSKYLKPRM